jgi:DNA-binding GntR family transcriptional regulator
MHSDSISKQLEMAILVGNIKPRERLVEMELSSRFKGSRFMIRKAIQELARKGLVEMIPHKGARVVDPPIERVEDMFVVRLNMELLATDLMIKNITREKLNEIKRVQKEYREAATVSSFEEMIAKNEEFHQTLYSATKNNFLHELLDKVRSATFSIRYNTYFLPGRRESSIKEHEAIIEALERKDATKLKTIVETSLKFPMTTFLARRAQGQRPSMKRPVRRQRGD